MSRRIYRVCRAIHARLDGAGANRAGGRWNSPGRPVVYMAETVSLAVLENLVHMAREDFPTGYVVVAALVPEEIRMLTRYCPLLVWTTQTTGSWEAFQRKGVLRADGRRVWREFRPAYRWLMDQMAKRIPSYGGGYPVWFWVRRPDLRRRAHLPSGEQGVRIELEIPRERVLLFDFESWHCALNRWRLSLTWREDRDWDRRTAGLDHRTDLPPELELELRRSWERMFDLALLRRSRLWGPVDEIQGVTEYLALEEVVRGDGFVAR